MTDRPQQLEAFGDAQVQALFDKFFPSPDILPEGSDRLTQRVLSEVQTIYGQGTGRSPIAQVVQRIGEWLANIHTRPMVIAFSTVAFAALILLAVSSTFAPTQTQLPTLAASVPAGEVVVLAARDDTYQVYHAGEQFSLMAGDQVIVRTGSVQLEPFPQQISEVLPGAQVELVTLNDARGEYNVELHVMEGQVRHRTFAEQPSSGAYVISAGGIRTLVQDNDFQIDALSPERAVVTALNHSARVETQGTVYEVMAGKSAEFGGRVMIVRDIAPVEEGPGQIAQVQPAAPAARPEVPQEVQTPGASQLELAPQTPALFPPAVDLGDESSPLVQATPDFAAAAVADVGALFTVGEIAVNDSGKNTTLIVNGTGSPGSAVQVLIENTPLVTTTVTAAGAWTATAPLEQSGHFAVNVAALDETGDAIVTVAAAEVQGAAACSRHPNTNFYRGCWIECAAAVRPYADGNRNFASCDTDRRSPHSNNAVNQFLDRFTNRNVSGDGNANLLCANHSYTNRHRHKVDCTGADCDQYAAIVTFSDVHAD
ncbi:MAG: hypothetical protein IPM07_01560 [Anaerolineales bacterium]|nr:hypothetical protein [Anaerolineales bacterium]